MGTPPLGAPPSSAADLDAAAAWWSPRLRRAALRRPPPGPAAEGLAAFPFAAWLAEALGPVRLVAPPEAAALLRRAGLAAGDHAAPALTLLADLPDTAPPGALLLQAPTAEAWAALLRQRPSSLGLRLPPEAGGWALLADPAAVPAPVAALLRDAARDPADIAALFAALGERLALAAARQEAEATRRALEQRAAAAEARASAALLRLQAIEGSTAWRALRILRRSLARFPRLERTLLWAARLGWRTILRPLVGPGTVTAGPAGPAAPPLPAEASLAVPGAGTIVFARGAAPAGATLIAGDGALRIEAAAPPAEAPSPGLGRRGFAAFFPHAAPLPPGPAVLALRRDGGAATEQPLPPLESLAPMEAIRAVLGRLAAQRAEDFAPLLRDHIAPAVDAFWAVRRAEPVTATEQAFGTPPAAPEVSVIVPLYGRMDFLLHQAAAFSNDPDLLTRAELIYVVDDPPAWPAAEAFARRAHLAYGVPLRLLRLSRNLGYSGANNAGARAARGAEILLLNSDVLPLAPGWLGAMVAARRSLPDCGALGGRLLFEEGTLQHAGMAFFPHPALGEDAWRCDHPFKGEPAAWDDPPLPREVPAVTGACLMVPRELYAAVGGLSEEYVIGDFEDADFCHRVAARGLRIWYDPRVALLHLERQSVALVGEPGWRHALTLCNMLRHGRLWAPRLRALAAPGVG